jgi:hypothetical protein
VESIWFWQSARPSNFIGTQGYLLSKAYLLSRKGIASEVVVPRTLVEGLTGTCVLSICSSEPHSIRYAHCSRVLGYST